MGKISKALKPLLLCLWVSGLYLFPVSSPSRFRFFFKGFLNIASVLVNITFLSGLVVHSIASLVSEIQAGFSSLSSLYITAMAIFTLYLALIAPLTASKRLRKLVRCLDAFQEEHLPRDSICLLKPLVVLGSVSCCGGALVISLYLFETCRDVFVSQNGSVGIFSPNLTGKILHSCTVFHLLLSIFSASFEFSVVSFVLLFQVNRFIKETSSYNSKILELNPSLLEKLRLRHESLCRLIALSSERIGHFLAVVYAGGIPCFLFVIHGFVYGSLLWEDFVHMVAFFVELSLTMCSVTIVGTVLNVKMHQPARYLLHLNIEKMVGKGPEVVAAFLSRLQGRSIGFHVYHLFTIDTSTILMVSGTILTYTVVIIQFQPSITGGGLAESRPSPPPPTFARELSHALNSSVTGVTAGR